MAHHRWKTYEFKKKANYDIHGIELEVRDQY